MLKNFSLWLVIAIVLIAVFKNVEPQITRHSNFAYSELLDRVKKGEIESIVIHSNQSISGKLKSKNIDDTILNEEVSSDTQKDSKLKSQTKITEILDGYMPIKDAHFLRQLIDQGVTVTGESPHQESFLTRLSLILIQSEIESVSIHSNQSISGKLKQKSIDDTVLNDKVSPDTQKDKKIKGQTKIIETFSSYMPIKDAHFLRQLIDQGVTVTGESPHQESFLTRLLLSWIPGLLPLGILFFAMRQIASNGKGTFSFGSNRARSIGKDEIKITFKDVAGVEEAKAEVRDLVSFLKEPGKVHQLGGKIPRGVLLMGEPGTGKTLLAKAVAGEAKVPFFTISGSDFLEMFVGVGAARVRSMFEQAKQSSPCIIFIDEIDAVGRHRGVGLGGGNDEREQTLNQLLVEMDGFSDNESVIVIAATNRPDVLDKALMRSGRFDRQVVVNLPDIQGRYEIFQVHLKKVKFSKATVDPMVLAKGTPGMSGADIQNMVNEAALQAASSGLDTIDMHTFEKAKDKIMMGAERSMMMSAKEKQITAYHEAGHAIVGWHMIAKGHDPIHKVTIMPRGRALGLTMFLPDEDRYSYSKQRLNTQLASLFGGRLAEELIFGMDQITTGASNDIQRATDIARNMVTKWGLSEKLGPLNYDVEQDESFNGRSHSKSFQFAEETIQQIDKEVRIIIDHAYQTAKNILQENLNTLHHMADMLVQYETIDAIQVQKIMSGEKIVDLKEAELVATKETPSSASENISVSKEEK